MKKCLTSLLNLVISVLSRFIGNDWSTLHRKNERRPHLSFSQIIHPEHQKWTAKYINLNLTSPILL